MTQFPAVNPLQWVEAVGRADHLCQKLAERGSAPEQALATMGLAHVTPQKEMTWYQVRQHLAMALVSPAGRQA